MLAQVGAETGRN